VNERGPTHTSYDRTHSFFQSFVYILDTSLWSQIFSSYLLLPLASSSFCWCFLPLIYTYRPSCIRDSPIIVLATRLSFMPRYTMLCTMTLVACLATKLCSTWCLYLASFTAFGDAPVKIGNALACGFGSEFIIPIIDEMGTLQLELTVRN
jgi:hypothetical protein